MKFFALAALCAVATMASAGAGVADTAQTQRYLVVFKDDSTLSGITSLVPSYSTAQQQAVALVNQAGGTVASNMVTEIGVVAAVSSNPSFAETLRSSGLVLTAAPEFTWKGVPTVTEARAQAAQDGSCSGDPGDSDCPSPSLGEEAFEDLQWDMQQICAVESDDARWAALCGTGAHSLPNGSGRPQVDVGVLDTGIDGKPITGHVDLRDNVDCGRGRDSIGATQTVPADPGIGTPDPCMDNGFHGTHVAGTIAADDNGIGMVGIAPNVRLVPVKVCDSTGLCYANAVVDGIYYAGHQKLDVINMSFFVDDNQFQQSHEFKCSSDPVQRTFRRAVERAIDFARNQGVTPVAALGNSDNDLAHPPEPYDNECDVVPAETQGVIGTMALGRDSQKASYSNYGTGMTDVGAPGGSGNTGDCVRSILSTFPANTYFCIQGTSMASPHATGVAALIVSAYGKDTVDTNDPSTTLDDTAPAIDVSMPPQQVENYLQSTTIDLINANAAKTLAGYDECFGNGRIDARRAVLHDTSTLREVVPTCADGQD